MPEFHRISRNGFAFGHISRPHGFFDLPTSDHEKYVFHHEDGNGNLQLTEIRGVLEDAGLLPQNDEDRERLGGVMFQYVGCVCRCQAKL